MKIQKLHKDEAGFEHGIMLLLLVVLMAIGYAGWRIYNQQQKTKAVSSSSQSTITAPSPAPSKAKTAAQGSVKWSFTGTEWKASGTPPDCEKPFLTKSPVDISHATAILYPGQTRNLYKPHGGFLFKNNTTNDEKVVLALDAVVVDGARYSEGGVVQYMFDFINDCGIMMRYDHLLALSPEFQKLADTLPPAKPDDSRTTNFGEVHAFKAGDPIATAVGSTNKPLNVGMDFGVYDLRQPNTSSKDAAYTEAHKDMPGTAYYGICWLGELPEKDSAAALALPGGDAKAGTTSDYCKFL